MKIHLALCLLTIAAVAPYPTPADGADQPPKRSKVSCDFMRTETERAAKSMKIELKVTPGSWGDLPTPLRKLPAGAELCGAGSMGQVIIVSAAFGKDLEKHYAPLFEELGCKPLKCTIRSTTDCGCSGPAGVGNVIADSAGESYAITYMKRKK